MALQVLNGPVIEAGESLSSGIDCTSGDIVRLTTPAAWTSANISFAISSDGNGYNDLYDVNGKEIVIPIQPNAAVVIGHLAADLRAVAFLKIRSGTRKNPVPQPERREFAIAVEVNAPA